MGLQNTPGLALTSNLLAINTGDCSLNFSHILKEFEYEKHFVSNENKKHCMPVAEIHLSHMKWKKRPAKAKMEEGTRLVLLSTVSAVSLPQRPSPWLLLVAPIPMPAISAVSQYPSLDISLDIKR